MSLNEPPQVTSVYRFVNGMVMVFDRFGQQMPEFQGRWSEMSEKIRESFSGPIQIEAGLDQEQ